MMELLIEGRAAAPALAARTFFHELCQKFLRRKSTLAQVDIQLLKARMDEYLPTFRLEFPGTYNEYRLAEGHVQFRRENGQWRILDSDDLRMHFMLKTPVASWIRSTSDQLQRGALA